MTEIAKKTEVEAGHEKRRRNTEIGMIKGLPQPGKVHRSDEL